MKKKVQIEEAQAKFLEMIEFVQKGSDVIIMDKHRAIAKLVRVDSEENESDKDKWTSKDFDIQLSDDL
jgi:antitoxin (DNA-binding transcriptional repressor) of toxin-antitoxin stability system